MLNPKGIDHICLIVTSLSQTQAYYSRLFDFSIWLRQDSPNTLVLESPLVRFFMVEVPDTPQNFLRLQHISFRVDNLDHTIKRLEYFGISSLETGQVEFLAQDNYRWCEWRDPDGIRLECVEII